LDASLVDRLVALRSAGSPAFAQDGNRLFHLADDSGLPQIWSLDLGSGARRQLTFHDEPVAFLARSPVGDALAYGTDVGGDERQQLWLLPAEGAARKLTARPDAIHSWGAFAPDGARIAYTANARNGVDFDLHLRDVAGGTERRLAALTGMQTVCGWSPDGSAILLREDRSHFDHELRLFEVASGSLRPLPRAHGKARYAALRWRKDGSGFYGLTELGGEHLGIVVYDRATDGFAPVFMAEGADIDGLALAPDGTLLAATRNRAGWSELLLVSTAGGDARPVASLPRGVIADLAWSPDSRRLAFSLTAPTRPRSLWLFDRATATARDLLPEIAANAGAGLDLVDWRLDEFSSFDDRRIPTFTAGPGGKPPPGGRKAVIWVHGGPESQTRPVFRPDIQALVAAGHAVMLPNLRGSTGYGRSYAALDDGPRRPDAVEDLRQARLWFGAQPDIDAARVAAMGQSYGGFMVLATLASHPELWKAAVEHYGFADFLTELRDTGPWRRRHRAAEYGDPERDRDFLHAASPLTHVDRIRAPLLATHGLRDPRVPPSETMALVAALRARGRTIETVIIENAGHGYLRRDHRRAVWGAVLDFLRRHL